MENDILKEELRKRNLTHMITEAIVIALYEQDQQQLQPPPPAVGAPATPQEQQQASTPAVEQQVPSVPDATQTNAEQITIDTLIERLNIVRGGKSFTDPEVYGQMTTYFKTMGLQERDIVYKFLLQISKIVTSNTQEQTQVADSTQQQQAAPQAQPVPPPQSTPPITPVATPAPVAAPAPVGV